MTHPKLKDARRRWLRALSHCQGLRGSRGDALTELALFVAFLGVPLLLGTTEVGFLVYDSMEVSSAADAGSYYGMQNLTAAGAGLTVTPTAYYVCSTAVGGTQYTGGSAQANATAACTGGANHPLEFVKVVTSASVTPPVHCPLLSTTFTVSGSSVMEVEQ
jgi:hypothetical protein